MAELGFSAILIPARINAATVKVVQLECDGPAERYPQTTTAKILAGAIGAEWIELVHSLWLDQRDLVMVVDEEGLLRHRPVNHRATYAFGCGNLIVGDVLVVAEHNLHGERDLVGLKDPIRELIDIQHVVGPWL